MKFVDKKLALKLKEKGFDRPCFNAYNAHGCQYVNGWCEYLDERDNDLIYLSDLHDKDCLCPTIDQVLEWLREEKKIIVTIGIYTNVVKSKFVIKIIKIVDEDSLTEHFIKGRVEKFFDNYDDTILAGIEYVINNLI